MCGVNDCILRQRRICVTAVYGCLDASVPNQNQILELEMYLDERSLAFILFGRHALPSLHTVHLGLNSNSKRGVVAVAVVGGEGGERTPNEIHLWNR